jgi:hypothetical protein
VKLKSASAKGKKQHDKREAEKDKDWKREQQRLMRRKALFPTSQRRRERKGRRENQLRNGNDNRSVVMTLHDCPTSM